MSATPSSRVAEKSTKTLGKRACSPFQNFRRQEYFSIFRLKIRIFRLQIHIFRLKIYIFSLKIEIPSDAFLFSKGYGELSLGRKQVGLRGFGVDSSRKNERKEAGCLRISQIFRYFAPVFLRNAGRTYCSLLIA